jgi:hypothetical protein
VQNLETRTASALLRRTDGVQSNTEDGDRGQQGEPGWTLHATLETSLQARTATGLMLMKPDSTTGKISEAEACAHTRRSEVAIEEVAEHR